MPLARETSHARESTVSVGRRARVSDDWPRRSLRSWLFLTLMALPLVWSASAAVSINELMSSNGATLADENGDSPDWIELYNSSPSRVDLDGWGLSDNPDRPFKWRFREATLGPGDFLLIYASGKDRQPTPVEPVPPASVPGLVLWLSAETVATNDPMQVRVTGPSLFVKRWLNQARAGGDAVQLTTAYQPRRMPAGLNGRPALRFDGVNDRLDLPLPPATNSFCLWAVFRTSQQHENDTESGNGAGGTSGQRYLFGARHGGDLSAGMGVSVGTNGVAVYEHGSNYMPALAAHHGSVGNGWVVVAVNYDARQPTLDVQGLIARVGTLSARPQVTAPTEIGSGAYGAFGGDLAEVMVFDRPLEATLRQGIAEHLANRYGYRLPEPRHTNFQLDAGGETLLLTHPDGRIADRVAFPVVPRDVSYGRQPDGEASLRFFEASTPGEANATPGSVELLEVPRFSHAAGFHASTVDLVMTSATPGAVVRYTLDGSEPTEQSPVHLPPLSLRSRTGAANDLSMIPTVPGGAPPEGDVFKGWVVRARTFKPGALPSTTVTRTFWITPLARARYTLPVLSLATARSNLFDPATGIYVPGNAPNGNYSQRGPEWQRPVHVEFHETDGTLAFAQEADVKIHGNTSQGFPIKGLDLDGTGGRGRQPFRYRIFPERSRSTFEHFLLRPTGHDQGMAFMRDELMQSLAAETGAESQAARPCVVFINGEYWGLHYLKEKEDAEFVSFYGDHPADDLDYLEGYAAAKAGDTAHYQEMLAFVEAHNLAEANAFDHLLTQIDLASYLDYKACEVFFYRWDIGNHRLWRPRTPEGRWRWLQFDNDVGWGGFWAEQPAWEFNMLEAVLTPSGSLHGHNNEATTFLFSRILANAHARRDFINRSADLLNTLLAPSNTVARIDRMAGALEPEMAEHTRRWRSPATKAEWQSHVEYLREYARRRPGFARQHLIQRFGLGGTASLTLSVKPAGSGHIRLNSLTLAAPDLEPWQGTYFRSQPVSLIAFAHEGHRFARWEGLPGATDNAVTILLNGPTTLQAVFVPATVAGPQLRIIRAPDPNRLLVEVTGTPGSACRLERSADLHQWHSLAVLTLDDSGKATWEQENLRAVGVGFYRAAVP